MTIDQAQRYSQLVSAIPDDKWEVFCELVELRLGLRAAVDGYQGDVHDLPVDQVIDCAEDVVKDYISRRWL